MAARQHYVDIALNDGAKISGLPAAAASGQAVEFDQFNAALEGLAWKDDVVAASTANINLAAPGSSIDGVTMASSNRFLAKNQTAPAENGIYIWTGAATVATRAPDMSASAEFNSAVVSVTGGTANDDTTWRQTAGNPTVGSTAIVFTAFNTGAAAASETTAGIAEIATQAETDTGTDDARIVTPLKLKTSKLFAKVLPFDVGDGSNLTYTLTHSLNTRDVQVRVYRKSGNYDDIECTVERSSVNAVVVGFNVAPSSAQYRAVVIGQQN